MRQHVIMLTVTAVMSASAGLALAGHDEQSDQNLSATNREETS